MAADEWLALPYEQRINTIKLFLQRECPDQYPTWDWAQFVLVEDETESQLRKWLAEGKLPRLTAVGAAMACGLVAAGDYVKRTGTAQVSARLVDLLSKGI